MITQSPIYRSIKTTFIYLAVVAYFLSFLAPYLLQVPQIIGFLNRTRILDKLSADIFWTVVASVGILFGLDKVVQGYQAASTHYFGKHTGVKAELYGIFTMLIGLGIVLFCVNLITGWWGTLQ